MPHISLTSGLPGILGLLSFRPDTAGPLGKLANSLLTRTDGLQPKERELIAAYVSRLNDCEFCSKSHGAVAVKLGNDADIVDSVMNDLSAAHLPDKMKSLLFVASQVVMGGKRVSDSAIEEAKADGATDTEIHDTVLIAAAFCMFNRYVDGLATVAPKEPAFYEKTANVLAEYGYEYVP